MGEYRQHESSRRRLERLEDSRDPEEEGKRMEEKLVTMCVGLERWLRLKALAVMNPAHNCL